MCSLLVDRHSLAYSRLLVFSLPHEMEFPLLIGQSCKKFSWVLRTETKANSPRGGMQLAGRQDGAGVGRWEVTSIPCLFALHASVCTLALLSLQ